MSKPQALPGTMTTLAYLSMGAALTCSFLMFVQVFSIQSGVGNAVGSEMLIWFLPAAVLFADCVLWRMAGHLHRRKAPGVMAIVVLSAMAMSAGSIGTSYMSTTMAVEQRKLDDRKASSTHQATEQASRAASAAAERLAFNLENMPRNYRTLSNNTAEQLQGLLDSQQKLLETQSATSGGAISAMDDRALFWWAVIIAVLLELAVLSIQLGLGVTSDGEQARRQGLQNIDTRGEVRKSPNLQAVK